MSSMYGSGQVARPRAGGRVGAFFGPVGVQHRDPRLDQPGQRRGDRGVERPRRPASRRRPAARARRRAGRSARARPARSAARSSDGRRRGAAGCRGPARPGSPLPGTAAATGAANRAPTLLARPARALASCTTIGTRPRRGQVGGQRDVAAEPDDDVRARPRAAPRGPRTPPSASGRGRRSRSRLGLRGSGTGGISSSG